jgi:hypothetical protein
MKNENGGKAAVYAMAGVYTAALNNLEKRAETK